MVSTYDGSLLYNSIEVGLKREIKQSRVGTTKRLVVSACNHCSLHGVNREGLKRKIKQLCMGTTERLVVSTYNDCCSTIVWG